MSSVAEALHPSLIQVLRARGLTTAAQQQAFLNPSLSDLRALEGFSQMPAAVARLRRAIDTQETIAIYADRDVDGLTGLAILVRSLKTLGARVVWGYPPKGGRGVDAAAMAALQEQRPRVMIFVDCGTGENETLERLHREGVDCIVADHHRLHPSEAASSVLWIHPAHNKGGEDEKPAGCVMAFKLAQGLWEAFLGREDTARLDYFLYNHLDLLALGILADRVPLTGENRVYVWHGLHRLALSRKAGLAALNRFLRIKTAPAGVREVTWRLIPMLNAAGRLGRPELAAQLLLTEDLDTAHACIDELLELNGQRRTAQSQSLIIFEQAVRDQCAVLDDPVLVAMATGLEPSVTGLAAQTIARKYEKPVFLFVRQGDEATGSGRGIDGYDMFACVEKVQDLLVKFGGHEGAAGLTIRAQDFAQVRSRLVEEGRRQSLTVRDLSPTVEATLLLSEATPEWWAQLQTMSPFGQGNPMPLFRLTDVRSIVRPPSRRTKTQKPHWIHHGAMQWPAQLREGLPEWPEGTHEGPWTMLAYPEACKDFDTPFQWIIHEVEKHHG